jgi:hypothetical protein
MAITSQIDDRVFTVRHGIAANLFVVLTAGLLLASSTISAGVGLLLISMGIGGVVITTTYIDSDQQC